MIILALISTLTAIALALLILKQRKRSPLIKDDDVHIREPSTPAPMSPIPPPIPLPRQNSRELTRQSSRDLRQNSLERQNSTPVYGYRVADDYLDPLEEQEAQE